MRATLLTLALTFLLLGCTTIGAGDADVAEQAARGALERDHVSDIQLTQVDERTFDFTGTREGQRCEGTVMVTIRGEVHSAAIQSRCE